MHHKKETLLILLFVVSQGIQASDSWLTSAHKVVTTCLLTGWVLAGQATASSSDQQWVCRAVPTGRELTRSDMWTTFPNVSALSKEQRVSDSKQVTFQFAVPYNALGRCVADQDSTRALDVQQQAYRNDNSCQVFTFTCDTDGKQCKRQP